MELERWEDSFEQPPVNPTFLQYFRDMWKSVSSATWEAVRYVEGIPVEGYYNTRFLVEICSAHAKGEGAFLKDDCHSPRGTRSYSIVLADRPRGTPWMVTTCFAPLRVNAS